jgi:hypothetical protein
LPLVARSGALVIEALAGAMTLFPFLLRRVDFDNDGLFMLRGAGRSICIG